MIRKFSLVTWKLFSISVDLFYASDIAFDDTYCCSLINPLSLLSRSDGQTFRTQSFTSTAKIERSVSMPTSSTTVRCSTSATLSAEECRCSVRMRPPSIRNTGSATGNTTSTVRRPTTGIISMTSLTRSRPKRTTNPIRTLCRRSSAVDDQPRAEPHSPSTTIWMTPRTLLHNSIDCSNWH